MPKKTEKVRAEPTELDKIVAELTELRPKMLKAKEEDNRGEYLRLKKRFDWLIEERDKLTVQQ